MHDQSLDERMRDAHDQSLLVEQPAHEPAHPMTASPSDDYCCIGSGVTTPPRDDSLRDELIRSHSHKRGASSISSSMRSHVRFSSSDDDGDENQHLKKFKCEMHFSSNSDESVQAGGARSLYDDVTGPVTVAPVAGAPVAASSDMLAALDRHDKLLTPDRASLPPLMSAVTSPRTTASFTPRRLDDIFKTATDASSKSSSNKPTSSASDYLNDPVENFRLLRGDAELAAATAEDADEANFNQNNSERSPSPRKRFDDGDARQTGGDYVLCDRTGSLTSSSSSGRGELSTSTLSSDSVVDAILEPGEIEHTYSAQHKQRRWCQQAGGEPAGGAAQVTSKYFSESTATSRDRQQQRPPDVTSALGDSSDLAFADDDHDDAVADSQHGGIPATFLR